LACQSIFNGFCRPIFSAYHFSGGEKKMWHRVIYIGLFVLVFLFSYAMGQEAAKAGGFKISSPAFENNGHIPPKYTCDGANVNPSLKIENVPSNTKSLALVFDDMDAPRGTYVHWILWNIDPNIKEIKENSVPEGAVQGMNDFKKHPYGGPCPPRRAHKYVFKIYALDTLLNLNPNLTKKDLEKAMEGHIISRAQLTGLYNRN
jgi:Raf kinase inhibitor-like YbhB/YbcL family protein